MGKRVLIVDKISDMAREIVEAAGFSADILPTQSEAELVKIIANYDAVIVRNQTKITSKAIDAAVNLKIIGRAGVGVDNIDVDSAARKGIWVVNSPDGNTVATSEHTLAMLLALSRKIPQAYCSTVAGNWNRNKFMGNELYAKTLGVIGFGKIGSRVARLADAFGMKIAVFDPYAERKQVENLGFQYFEKLEEILPLCDYITVHVPKTKDTTGLINKDNIKLMKDEVKIVNCARGGIAVEKDLAQALKDGKIGGAALDVYEDEPDIKKSPLFNLEGNIILVPHLGASTYEAQTKVAIDVTGQIVDVLNGKLPRTPVNKV